MRNDKEMFEWKKQTQTQVAWDRKCKEKAPGFLEARKAKDFEQCFHELCHHMDIQLNKGKFVYFFDYDFRFETSIKNITPDYSKIINQGITSLLYEKNECSNEFCKQYNSVVWDMFALIDRVIGELEKQAIKSAEKIQWFRNMKNKRAGSFAESLQRVLFLNQLIWQTGSKLVGLGRLDMFLWDCYDADIKSGMLTKKEAEEIIMEFLNILHAHYWYKSSVMLGDTGQVIVLGGMGSDGVYQANELTYLFLNVLKSSQLSDPKLILRTSAIMPRILLEEAVRCMATGIGSPLLSNDDIIIPKLIEFGVEKEDAYAYTTSACWEPLIGGKSSSMNNQNGLVYIKALNAMLMEEPLGNMNTFDALKDRLWIYLRREVRQCEKNLYEQEINRNTLYSVFMEGCYETKKDIVDGGAKYHNIGMTTVGLGNLVNALLNIEKLVYTEKQFSLTDVKKMSFYDYEGYHNVVNILKESAIRYGQDEEKVIALCNEILGHVSELTKNFRTRIGGRLKFGVSSPDYIMRSGNVAASFDGRRNGEPFIVHISNENSVSYTELINFAAAIDYGENRFNGNVVDLMVSPSFIGRNFDKFVSMLIHGGEIGYFQLQINVINSGKLTDAKLHPEKYPNLIVRVWGFSAYFVELPEDYQNFLIERALRNEGRAV